MRAFETVVKTILNALRVPSMVVLIEFPGLGLRMTNWPKTITWASKSYVGARTGIDGTHKFKIEFEGLGENLDFETPAGTLKIHSLTGYFQQLFQDDVFRGELVTITLLYVDTSGDFQATGWATTYTCDADECTANDITLRLASSDAIHGTELPRRTTQTDGCQHNYAEGECTFVLTSKTATEFKTCDHSFASCKKRFPDVTDPDTGLKVPQPKPYGATLGGVDHSIVRA